MDWTKHVAVCEERLQSALAPLTAPNPAEAKNIEQAIGALMDAKIAMAFSNWGVGPVSQTFTSRAY